MLLEDFNNLTTKEQHNYFKNLKGLRLNQRGVIYGFGINDTKYPSAQLLDNTFVMDPAYKRWQTVLERCYSKPRHKRAPTYVGVTCCEEWMYFSNFLKWWEDNYVEGYHLDKDILVTNNRVYSPDTCIFIPMWLNSFVAGSKPNKGVYPIGVTLDKNGKFRSRCNDLKGGRIHLGIFKTPTEAYEAWLNCKLKIVDDIKTELDRIDKRLYEAVILKIKSM